MKNGTVRWGRGHYDSVKGMNWFELQVVLQGREYTYQESTRGKTALWQTSQLVE